MPTPNNYRSVLFEQAMEFFPRRHATNAMQRRNVRDKLNSFFAHGKSWRRWAALPINNK